MASDVMTVDRGEDGVVGVVTSFGLLNDADRPLPLVIGGSMLLVALLVLLLLLRRRNEKSSPAQLSEDERRERRAKLASVASSRRKCVAALADAAEGRDAEVKGKGRDGASRDVPPSPDNKTRRSIDDNDDTTASAAAAAEKVTTTTTRTETTSSSTTRSTHATQTSVVSSEERAEIANDDNDDVDGGSPFRTSPPSSDVAAEEDTGAVVVDDNDDLGKTEVVGNTANETRTTPAKVDNDDDDKGEARRSRADCGDDGVVVIAPTTAAATLAQKEAQRNIVGRSSPPTEKKKKKKKVAMVEGSPSQAAAAAAAAASRQTASRMRRAAAAIDDDVVGPLSSKNANKAQKRRKRRRKKAPAALLCEALSAVTRLTVVASEVNDVSSSNDAVLLLPLEQEEVQRSSLSSSRSDNDNDIAGHGSTRDDEQRKRHWDDLLETFRTVLFTSRAPTNPFDFSLANGHPDALMLLLRRSAEWYGRIASTVREERRRSRSRRSTTKTKEGVAAAEDEADEEDDKEEGAGETNFEDDADGIERCLLEFGRYLASSCAKLLYANRSKGSNVDGEEEEEEDLFSDDYGTTVPVSHDERRASSQSAANNRTSGTGRNGASAFDHLATLLEDGDRSVVTGPFLSEAIRSDFVLDDNKEEEGDDGEGGRIGLASLLLQRVLDRLPRPEGDEDDGDTAPAASSSSLPLLPSDVVHRRIAALSRLLSISPEVVRCLADRIRGEVDKARCDGGGGDGGGGGGGGTGRTGRKVECASILRPLLSLVGHTVPEGGVNERFARALVDVAAPRYPLCVFERRGSDPELQRAMEEARSISQTSRDAAMMALRKAIVACGKEEKEDEGRGRGARSGVFDWLSVVVRSNDNLTRLLDNDLLSNNGTKAHCSTSPFLLGTISTVLNLCCQSLVDRFERMGADAFEVRYLVAGDDGMLGISPDERCLAPKDESSSRQDKGMVPLRFTGGTEFFFLSGALLRVGLFPALRIKAKYMEYHDQVFATLRELAGSNAPQVPRHMMGLAHRSVGAFLGWRTFLEDPEFVSNVTNFALLQLRWLVALSKCDQHFRVSALFDSIPEWFCKLPAQWIAHVATYTPALMRPHQGDAAIRCATELLQIGSECGKQADNEQFQLAPPVLTELIRIASAFVRSGVNRARWRHLNRYRKAFGGRADDNEDYDIDDRDLDIYSSFDSDDLGVTVFTNNFVLTRLCPALMSTFGALDAVVGMDVDREHNFDKFAVKGDVAELLLRLWSHPSGECRKSIVNMKEDAIGVFASSVAAAIGTILDSACHKVIDLRDVLKNRQSGFDERFYEAHSKRLAGELLFARKLLLLLLQFSVEPRSAAILGGTLVEAGTVSKDMSSLFVHFIDVLCGLDGGTHKDLDFRDANIRPSTSLSQEVLPYKKGEDIKNLLYSRRFVLVEFGLDISVLAHQFLALAAHWHAAALAADKGKTNTAAFLNYVAAHHDCSMAQLKNIFERLTVIPELVEVSESEKLDIIFEHDGHVNTNILKDFYEVKGSGPDDSRARRSIAKQDRMTHERLEAFSSREEISTFLQHLEKAATKIAGGQSVRWGGEEMTRLQQQILSASQELDDEKYSGCLENFVVSSDSFLSQHREGLFAHCYDVTARNQVVRPGKKLIKEARKCLKNLPKPHPNASIFVCFAEERMDLCRSVIIGAVDTPYSLGMFEFDVFFPASYPAIPPLVTFMTTGGGQIRFSPNLYNDGKVCVSLLGTAHASDQSQRWNPSHSSLAQVLISVQAGILGVPDPFFREGFGHEALQDTDSGRESSHRYNNKLRLATLRHAIIGQLKSPPTGFEEIVLRHFSACRGRLLVQARRWTMEAKHSALYARFQCAYEELVVLLSSNEPICLFLRSHEEICLRGEADNNEASEEKSQNRNFSCMLPPNKNDVRVLQNLDPDFTNQLQMSFGHSTGEAAASQVVKQSVARQDNLDSTRCNETKNLWDSHQNDKESSDVAEPEKVDRLKGPANNTPDEDSDFDEIYA